MGDWTRHNPVKTALLVLVGFVVAVTVPLQMSARERKRRYERERLEAEAAAKRARLEAEAAARTTARKMALARLHQLTAEARRAADSLSITLGEAEIILDRAEDELKSKLPSPFWEAIEEALAKVRAFHHALSVIQAAKTAYITEAAQLDGDAPEFALGVSVLPDPTALHDRLNRLYRKAQSIPHFSIVYEQRRTTETLIAGFRSLGQAIERLGDRMIDEIGSLAQSLDCRLDSLESSLRSSAAAAADQSEALHEQLKRAAGSNEALRRELREGADARSEAERQALRMLDNIQRRRKP
jgi:DNA anti-recombination protein RmuC